MVRALALQPHRRLSKDWAQVEALLVELAPAWAELRQLLNELNRVLSGSSPR
jgi:hypothetical protein